MSRIYLTRHGQDEDNEQGILNGRRDKSLTELGVKQAEALAENLKQHNIIPGKVFSSPLVRTYQTASIVTDLLGLAEPERLELLIERDFGVMTGQLVADIERLCAPAILKANPITYFLEVEGAETFPAMVERSNELLAWLKENGYDQNVLLVTHGDIGKMIYAAFYDLHWEEVLMQFHFGNSEVLLLDETSDPSERHLYKTEQYNH
jgi:broad specificity phosphatase PhoE